MLVRGFEPILVVPCVRHQRDLEDEDTVGPKGFQGNIECAPEVVHVLEGCDRRDEVETAMRLIADCGIEHIGGNDGHASLLGHAGCGRIDLDPEAFVVAVQASEQMAVGTADVQNPARG
ncbi:hypothetical protein D9M72_523470 [compost metagenome]